MTRHTPVPGQDYPIPRYIFVPEEGRRVPEPYRARWHDTWGFFALLTPNHCGGHYPVTLEAYVAASDAYAQFVEMSNLVGELSDYAQESQRTFISQIEQDPLHQSVPAIIEAACKALEKRMVAHARYEASKLAWEAASRDVQTVEELDAREQAFANALERCENSPDVTTSTKMPVLH